MQKLGINFLVKRIKCFLKRQNTGHEHEVGHDGANITITFKKRPRESFTDEVRKLLNALVKSVMETFGLSKQIQKCNGETLCFKLMLS